MGSSTRGSSVRVTLAVALVGLSGAWSGGNVGPVASELAGEFDVSLAVVGLLSGTLFLGSVVVGLLVAAPVGERIGRLYGLRLACALVCAGNLVFAISPVFLGLAVGRVLPGLAFALVNAIGAVWARDAGGVRLLGVFGASIQLGLALALLIGSGLADLGIDWRVGFLVSAALGVLAYVAIPADTGEVAPARRRETGFLRAALRHARVWRLALLFMSIFGVPLILSAWMIEYLSRDGSVATAIAGTASFVLFGLSAVMRVAGARLQQRGVPHAFLSGTLALAVVGLAAITLEPVAAVALLAAAVLAVGFGVPYALALSEAQELYPSAPSEPVALMTLLALVPPMVVIPVVGHAIARDHGDLAFGALTAFLLLATLANLRRTGIPLTATSAVDPAPAPDHARA